VARDRTEHSQRSECDCPLQRLSLGLPPQQCDLERCALRRGKLSHLLVGNLGQQIAECCVCKLCLGLDRSTDEHAVRALRRLCQACLPQGGLSDPHLALEHESDGAGFDTAQELGQLAPLLRAADERLQVSKHRKPPSSATRLVQPFRCHKTQMGLPTRSAPPAALVSFAVTRVLALDVGTSSVRAHVFDESAEEGEPARREYSGVDDPDRIVALVRDAIAEADTDAIDAAGTSSFGHSLIALNASGRPLTPLLGWRDT